MTRRLDFYFDFVSPYSYLAFTQLPELARRTGVEVVYKPIDVLEVMRRVGNVPTTIISQAKGRYARADLTRWVQRYGVPFVPNPHFKTLVSRPLLLGAISARRTGVAEQYVRAVFEGVWTRRAAFSDDAETLEVLRAGGFDPTAAAPAPQEETEEELEALIVEAVNAGVFGVPSFVLEGELFFGNDRLDFLTEELAR